MNWKNIATIVAGAIVTVAPQLIGQMPKPYQDLATSILSVLMLTWHLYQPSPSTK